MAFNCHIYLATVSVSNLTKPPISVFSARLAVCSQMDIVENQMSAV
jgi:hypothetical protein